MSFKQKILNKSDSYSYYKKSHDSLKAENEKLKADLKNKDDELKRMTNRFRKLDDENKHLSNLYENDYIYYDTDSLFSRFYTNPFLKHPFTSRAKWGLAFMDHLAKKLESNVDSSENQPFVSIIFPVHNYESYIKKAIGDVLNQTYSNLELIVIDDNSIDGTGDMLKSISDDRVKVMSNEHTKGSAHCRNIALNVAQGDFIFYLDMYNSW